MSSDKCNKDHKILNMSEFIRDKKYRITSKYDKNTDGSYVSWVGTFSELSVYFGEFDDDYEEFPIFVISDKADKADKAENKKKIASFENNIIHLI